MVLNVVQNMHRDLPYPRMYRLQHHTGALEGPYEEVPYVDTCSEAK